MRDKRLKLKSSVKRTYTKIFAHFKECFVLVENQWNNKFEKNICLFKSTGYDSRSISILDMMYREARCKTECSFHAKPNIKDYSVSIFPFQIPIIV